jgi:hypothetical protein
MAGGLQEILGWSTLTALVKEQTDGLPSVLPDAFANTTRSVVGDIASYVRVPGTRNLALRVEYGAPALRVEHKGITTVPVKLLHSFTEITFHPSTLMNLRQYADYAVQNMGREEIARQTMSMSVRQKNLRLVSILQALALGANYFDGGGNMLPTSSGATVTVDYAIPANNKNQLNGIIAASWALPTTDIPSQLRSLKQTAAQLTGYPLKYAFYGKNIPSYLTQNDFVLDYLARNPPRNSDYLGGGELGELFGLTWVPAYEAFWEDQNGTNQTVFGDDAVVFTPAPSREWWEIFEGSYPVPASIDIAGEGLAAAGNVRVVTGQGAYGRLTDNPVTIICRYFDTFLPVIKVPKAIFIADTTP